jgi:hypothetical protein
MSNATEARAVERVILVNIKEGISETRPNHATFGLQEWLPIIANEILVDYVMTY